MTRAVREALSFLLRAIGKNVGLRLVSARLPIIFTSGLGDEQIAAELGITGYTIQIHGGNIMRKMKADSFATLLRMTETLKPESARTTSREALEARN